MKGWDKEEIVPDGGDHHVCVPMAVRLEIEPGGWSNFYYFLIKFL